MKRTVSFIAAALMAASSFAQARPVAVTGVTVAPSSLALVAGGATAKVAATVSPANASNKNIIWSSDNPGVASVSAGGVVTPQKPGTAKVVAKTVDGNRTANCVVNVSAKRTEAAKAPPADATLKKSASATAKPTPSTPVAAPRPAPAGEKAIGAGKSGIAIGIRAGLDMASLSYGEKVDSAMSSAVKNEMGYSIGASFAIPVWKGFGLQPELHYSAKGATFESGGQRSSISLQYLELPLFVRYGMTVFKNLDVFVLAGPYGALGLSGKMSSVASTQTYEPDKDFNRLDFGAIGGGGIRWRGFSLEARYGFGFAIVNDVPSNRTRYGYEYWHRNLYFLAGYSLAL